MRENLAFPLKMRKMKRDDIKAQVERTAKVLSIDHLLERRPRELSGGQQQRVALGRALVRNPRAFLMDEPLSNLDAKLRVQMRAELKRFHQELNATVLYVTHDQLEAVTMADKIAVMNNGVLQQYASPDDVFNRPVNTFVAGFIGSPAMNLIPGRVQQNGDARRDRRAKRAGSCRSPRSGRSRRCEAAARSYWASVTARSGCTGRKRRAHLPPSIYTVEPTGDLTFVHFRLGGQLLVASAHADFRANPDDPIWVEFDQDHLHVFDANSQAALAEASETVAPCRRPSSPTRHDGCAVS